MTPSPPCDPTTSHLSRGDAHTQPVHRWLLLALVDLGELPQLQDVRLASSGQDPLALAGHVLVLLADGLQVAAGGTAGQQRDTLVQRLFQSPTLDQGPRVALQFSIRTLDQWFSQVDSKDHHRFLSRTIFSTVLPVVPSRSTRVPPLFRFSQGFSGCFYLWFPLPSPQGSEYSCQ